VSSAPAASSASRAATAERSCSSSRSSSEPLRQRASSTIASTKKGSFGIPGSRPIAKIVLAAMAVAFGRLPSWVARLAPSADSVLSLVTSTPAAVEMSSAGIWLTRPSPMVSIE
jgi:hypothetical protein